MPCPPRALDGRRLNSAGVTAEAVLKKPSSSSESESESGWSMVHPILFASEAIVSLNFASEAIASLNFASQAIVSLNFVGDCLHQRAMIAV